MWLERGVRCEDHPKEMVKVGVGCFVLSCLFLTPKVCVCEGCFVMRKNVWLFRVIFTRIGCVGV